MQLRMKRLFGALALGACLSAGVNADVAAGAGWLGTVSEVHFRNYGANGSPALVYFLINYWRCGAGKYCCNADNAKCVKRLFGARIGAADFEPDHANHH